MKLPEDFPHGAQLVDAGFTTTHKVQTASDDELLAIEGIGPAGLEKIRAASVPESKVSDEAAVTVARKCANPACGYEITESPCPYCGTV